MSYITLNEQASAVATPASGKARVYVGTDGLLRSVDDAGAVTAYGGGGSSNYQTVRVNGTAQTARAALNALNGNGITVSGADDSGAGETELTIALATGTLRPIVLYDNTLASSGTWDVDLTGITDGTNCVHLELHALLRGTVALANDTAYLFYNNNTTVTNYYILGVLTQSGSTTSVSADAPTFGVCPAASSPANYFGYLRAFIPFYGSTTQQKITAVSSRSRTDTAASYVTDYAHHFESTAAITRIQVRTDNHATDTFATSSRLMIVGYRSL